MKLVENVRNNLVNFENQDPKIKRLLTFIMDANIEKYNQYPSDLDGFSNLKKNIWSDITEKMSFLYEKKDKNFVDSFKSGRFNALSTENKNERKQFLDLMILRNRIYEQILLWLLENWNFNKLLNETEINDLIVFIKSNISNQFDKTAQTLEDEYLENYDESNIDTSKKQYAWVKNGEIKPYNEFIDTKKINLSSMSDKSYIKKYFTEFLNLIEKWKTDYDKFIKIEENEVKSWKEKQKLSFTAPMENYHKDYLIDLWYEIHLSEHIQKEEIQNMQDLSNKYFWSWFGMNEISLTFVEMMLTGGDNSFIQVLWRSFPNDEKLSNKFWKIIYIAKERNNIWAVSAVKTLKKLWIDVNKTSMKFIKLAEVKYHEFWHSLFKEDKPNDSIVEELKATLFYYLHLYNQHIEIDLWYEELIWFIITEYIRRITQQNNPSSYEYWLLDSFIYNKVVKNNLVSLENWEITINEDNEWFTKFLEDMKNALFEIQRLYKIKDNKKRKEEELKFVWDIFKGNIEHEEFYRKTLDL